MRKKLVYVLRLLLILLPLAPISGNAQNAQGGILGQVRDPSGASVGGAHITLLNVDTKATKLFTTSASGDYQFVDLIPDHYTVSVDMDGFQRQVTSLLTVEVNQTIRQDFSLVLGSVSQETVVTADTQMLQTDDATLGTVIDSDLMSKLPLNGRDFTNLLQVTMGASVTPGGIQTTGYVLHGLNNSFQEVSINGARADSIAYSIDGVNDTDFFFSGPTNIPSELTIQEFKSQNGLYGAEFGQGSTQVNVAIKSGANIVHGAAYEFYRGSVFQPDSPAVIALNALSGVNNNPNLSFNQNQFGGTLGGPVVLPRIYNGHDKTFWFFGYDGGRRNQATNPTSLVVPSAKMLAGDFSEWPYPIYDPATTGTVPATATNPSGRQPFLNNNLAGRIDPKSANLLSYFDSPNISSCTNLASTCKNFSGSVTNTLAVDTGLLRLDQDINSSNHVFFTGIMSNETDRNPSVQFGAGSISLKRTRLFGVTWDQTISPKTLNQVTVGYNRQHYFTGQNTANGPNLSALAGFANVPNIPSNFDIPNVTFFNYSSIGGNSPYNLISNIYQLVDSLTLVRGRHTFNTGFDFRRVNLKDSDTSSAMGVMNFNGEFTASIPADAGQALYANGAATATAPYEGNAFADFLLGQASSATGPPPLGAHLYGLWGVNYNGWGQDDFHATERLTLNIGLRWERPANLHSVTNSGWRFNPAGQGSMVWANQAYVAPILAAGGNPNYLGCCTSNKLTNVDDRDFAPRIGLAYRPPFSDKVAIRAGYGLFYDIGNRWYDLNIFTEDAINSTTAAVYTSPTGSESHSTAIVQNLWAAPLQALSSFTLPSYTEPLKKTYWPFNHTPYNQQWSLQTEYSIRPTTLLEVGYVGSHSIHEDSQWQFNAAFLPTYGGTMGLNNSENCNQYLDYSLATATCKADSRFQPVDTRLIWSNLNPQLFANANVQWSNYNGLQVQLSQRPVHGLQYKLDYTYSRNLGTASGINNVNGETSTPQDPHNIAGDYGPLAADQTHRLVVTYAYALPFGNGRFNLKGLNWLIGGWSTSGILKRSSGFPFELSAGRSNDDTGNSTPSRIRPNYAPSGTFTKSTLTHYFDTAGFSSPVYGRYGNTSRGFLRTPYFQDIDMTFGKIFRIKERQQLQYRAEVFNLGSTWHSSAGLLEPNATLTNSSFGSFFSANPQIGRANLFNPRYIQMGLQYTF
jgi:hypothetical protein